MNILSTLKAYAWQAVAALLFVSLATTGFKLWTEQLRHADTRADRDRISLTFANYIGEQKTINKEAADKARSNEQALQTDANKFKERAYVQIDSLKRERDAARDSLRNRPSRPAGGADGAGLSAPAGPGAEARGCTAAELYREDAEVALGAGYDFEELRIEYDKLWDIYQRARAQAENPVNAK